MCRAPPRGAGGGRRAGDYPRLAASSSDRAGRARVALPRGQDVLHVPRLRGLEAILLLEPLELTLKAQELLVREGLQVDHPGARPVDRAQELVQLEVNRARVAVLRVLDEEDHEKRDDRG